MQAEKGNTAEIQFYTPAEFQALLNTATGPLRALIAIGGLAGLRTAELMRLTWEDVSQAPTFGELWPQLTPLLAGARFLAAHNAGFDRGVLKACCEAYGLAPPALPFRCTVTLSRQTWRLYPTKLPDVCAHLGIPLTHHHAASDAEACARIVLAALNGAGRDENYVGGGPGT